MYTLINLSFVTVKVREVTKHKNKIDTNPPEARFEDVKYASFQLNLVSPGLYCCHPNFWQII